VYLRDKNKYKLKVKELKKIFQTNTAQKQAGVTILIFDKIAFKPKLVISH
jgi:hypothetical protein